MSAHNKAYAAILKPLVYLPALAGGAAAGQDGTAHARRAEISRNIRKMLPRKHLRRSHETGLIAIANGDKGAKHSNHGLARTNVALKEAVHLPAAAQIVAYLLYNPLLRSRKLVRQGVVAGIEIGAYLWHEYAAVGAAAYVLLLYERKLEEEELLELQAESRSLKGLGVLGEMNVLKSVAKGTEALFAKDVIGKRLSDGRKALLKGGSL